LIPPSPALHEYSPLSLKKKDGKISTTNPVQRRHRAPPGNGSTFTPPASGNSISADAGGAGSMDQFNALKREATKLERNLEDKVSRYQSVSNQKDINIHAFVVFAGC
jgi:hypothetical protein